MIKIGLLLILIGFALVFIGTVLSSGNAEFGGLIMIGPIPIAFGTSPGITMVTMIIGLLMVLVYFILGRRNA